MLKRVYSVQCSVYRLGALDFVVFLLFCPPPVYKHTFQSIGDESVCLFTFWHGSVGAAVSLSVVAYDGSRPPSSSVRVQGGVGWSQEARRVRVRRSCVVNVAISSDAVCVRLA